MSQPYDVIVIGGGASGMMAAGRAAECGARVLILEKNESLGKKLLITGGGRCNVTNAEPDLRTLLSLFKDSSSFLFSPFAQWNNLDARSFFELRGMPTKVENEQRVFPVSDSAQSVWNVLKKYLDQGNVAIKYESTVRDIVKSTQDTYEVILSNGTSFYTKKIIIATGGRSRPETGSTGDGFSLLKKMGHTVVEPVASLVPVAIQDRWVKELQGVSLEKVRISVIQNNQKQVSRIGKTLFTHFGITGPTILNMSKDIGEYLKYGPVDLALDLFPGVDLGTLNKKLTDLFQKESNKHIKNVMASVIAQALVDRVLAASDILGNTPCHSITREQRMAVISAVKALSMRVTGLLGTDKAIITSGGVPLSEIDTKTMESKILPGIFVVGDMLDIDRPSGGYSLQLCWTSGYVAGSSVVFPK